MSNLDHSATPDFGAGRKTLNVYILGVLLCIILTLIPFSAVMYNYASKTATYYILGFSALAQFFVQAACFLRLNLQTEQSKMNVLAFFFSILVLLVVICGSLWIMWHLNYNMMH
jgi:cytochrome o ubiquinol oxidase subunit IV